MTPHGEAPARARAATGDELPLTAGGLAMINLNAQIDGLKRRVTAGTLPAVNVRGELIELVALRGQVLGRITDYEWAEEQAEQLARAAPADGVAFVARARAHARFHRFTDALADLDTAQRLGANPGGVNSERAGVYQAIGRYEQALTIYNDDVAKPRPDSHTLGSLATLTAERGDIVAAERLFDESRERYRGVSPFPPALLDFRRGLMWLEQGDLDRAFAWLKAAVRSLPDYAPAQGHLAEVEAAVGDPDAAIARLLPLTDSSDDPDYAASLARILAESGRMEAADEWREKAAARYDELLTRHPEAFADHAAEFWLEAGADPDRALGLARMNLEVRGTPRANELFARASLAATS